MKNELETLKRQGSFRGNIFADIFKAFDKTEIAELVFLFLLSRICISGHLLSPFGPALFTALFVKEKRLSYPVFAVLGVLSAGFGAFTFKYIGIILIISSILVIFAPEIKKNSFAPSAVCAGAVFLNGMVYVIAEGFFAYDALLLALECLSVIPLYFALEKATVLIKTITYRKIFEQQEIFSLLILCAITVLSISLMENLLPIGHVLSICMILILSISCGYSVSCPAGVIFGLCLAAESVYQAQTICIYCIASLASGLLKKYGKIGTAIAFSLSSLVFTILICPESNGIVTVSYVALATLILFFIPDKFIAKFGSLRLRARHEFSQSQKIRSAVDTCLAEKIESIDSVNLVFRDVLNSYVSQNGENHGIIFDKTASAVCKKCSLCNFCWSKNREDTLNLMNSMYKTMEHKDTLKKSNVPQEFSDKCIKCDMFLTELNKNYEAFKVSKMWAGKVLESKKLVAEQFLNISMILKNIKLTLSEKMCTEPELEGKIAAALDRKGISAEKIYVSSGDGFSVSLDKVSCGKMNVCETKVAAALCEVLEVPMLREIKNCENDICHLKFSQKTRFLADISTSATPCINSFGSGDSVLHFPIGNGKIAIILSDGMGTGENASFQSSVTTNLAKKLLTSGFDKETTVRLINNILMLNADKETFSTIDLCILNLYTGAMEFVKYGAANSYIKAENENETIYASSLPAGVLDNASPDFDMRYMKAGEFLIMASDGVCDVLDTQEENEILSLANGFTEGAKELSELILNTAVARSGGAPLDDLTVVVCKILENF